MKTVTLRYGAYERINGVYHSENILAGLTSRLESAGFRVHPVRISRHDTCELVMHSKVVWSTSITRLKGGHVNNPLILRAIDACKRIKTV